jgi:hypothetical protein
MSLMVYLTITIELLATRFPDKVGLLQKRLTGYYQEILYRIGNPLVHAEMSTRYRFLKKFDPNVSIYCS